MVLEITLSVVGDDTNETVKKLDGKTTTLKFDITDYDDFVDKISEFVWDELEDSGGYELDERDENAAMIQLDFNQVIANQTSIVVDTSNRLVCPENIFIAEGASLSGVSLNATDGPIYIGKNAILMEGAAIRGPFVLGEKGVVKMNACIYGATSVGPYCTIGGEIKNSILMGYSNKAHEGYLGDSIIGQWCNLGAGTCNSNVKNTAGPIQIWNQYQKSWDTIGNKMGMLVGDYTRFAIQSSINTGSYIGASANIYGNGLLPKMIPNFSWGITKGYVLEKAIEDIQNWKKMKGFQISDAEKEVLTALFHME